MTNRIGLRRATLTKARKTAVIFEATRAGWVDAVAGRGFSRDYETQDRVWQMNYETARATVVFARAARTELPRWPANVRLPRAVADLVAAAQKSGAVLHPSGS